MKWYDCEFKDFIILQRGFDLPKSKMKDGEIPVLGSNCIIGYHNEPRVNPPGVITGRSGTLGVVQYVNDPYWPHNTALWVKDFKGNDPRFVYYKLKTLNLEMFSSGASVPTLNRNNLDNLIVSIPEVEQQQRIASILSAYDDLIENNQRRIKLLEESAQLLYKEWFVRLRFPGYEHTRIIDGVPEGWERKKLKEVCQSVSYGYTASVQNGEVGPKFLRITDIVPDVINWTSVPFCKIPEEKKEKYLLSEGDIVVARTGATVGYAKRLHKRHSEAVFASYLVRFRIQDDIDDLFVGIFVESGYYKNYVKSQVGGAAQPNANAQVLAGASILVPPKKIQDWFHEIVEPIYDQKELLQIQNLKLRQARDILLPRLLGGEVEVYKI